MPPWMSPLATLAPPAPTLAQAEPSPRTAALEAKVDRALTAAERLSAIAWDMGPKVLGALLILIAAWVVAKQARRSLYKAFDRPQVDQTLLRFATNAVRWVLLIVALVAALGVLGFPPASVVTVMGAAGLAVGLALQGSLANLAAGIMLLVLRPFKVGDVINVAGVTGKVDEIELFMTKIDTADLRRVVVPNSQVFGNVIDNQTHHPVRTVTIVVPVASDADLDATRDVLAQSAASVPDQAPGAPPAVSLEAVSGAGVTWNVTVRCATGDMIAVRQALLRATKLALDGAGVGSGNPQTITLRRERAGVAPAAGHAPANGRA